ncbi:MAG: AAA family ATPase [Acidobacteria bacterium]|nr:AAA family ATPase [Acidobacteriota bacterium]
MQAVIFVGVPGSGKSSFYKERFFATHVRINLDMLKTRHREGLLVRACLAALQPFVVDNTNLWASHRAVYIGLARAAGFRVEGYYFDVSLGDALRRNAQREGRAAIPRGAVAAAFKRIQKPTVDEGFDALHLVRVSAEGFSVEAWP